MNRSTIQLDWNCLLGFDQARAVEGNALVSAAKVGHKDVIRPDAPPLGRNLAAKVGQKEFVRFGACLPLSVTAKIGFKES